MSPDARGGAVVALLALAVVVAGAAGGPAASGTRRASPKAEPGGPATSDATEEARRVAAQEARRVAAEFASAYDLPAGDRGMFEAVAVAWMTGQEVTFTREVDGTRKAYVGLPTGRVRASAAGDGFPVETLLGAAGVSAWAALVAQYQARDMGPEQASGAGIGMRDPGADPIADAVARAERDPDTDPIADAVARATREGRPVDVRVLIGAGRSQEWETVTAHPDGRVTGRNDRVVRTAAQSAERAARRRASADTDGGVSRA